MYMQKVWNEGTIQRASASRTIPPWRSFRLLGRLGPVLLGLIKVMMMPPAARITDMHTCPHTDPIPHVGGPIVSGCASVIIGNQPAARVGDIVICIPFQDKITAGEVSVLIDYKQAARLGDPTDGGVIIEGCPTVLIGKAAQAGCAEDAARQGAPFIK